MPLLSVNLKKSKKTGAANSNRGQSTELHHQEMSKDKAIITAED